MIEDEFIIQENYHYTRKYVCHDRNLMLVHDAVLKQLISGRTSLRVHCYVNIEVLSFRKIS